MNDNVCPCPDPPGGSHSCPAGNVAVCSVDGNGQVHGRCYPASGRIRHLMQTAGATAPGVRGWLLATLFPDARASEYETRFELDLIGGRIWDRGTNTRVQFRLPDRHKDMGGATPSFGARKPIPPAKPVGKPESETVVQEKKKVLAARC